jgi:hypothetical protein
MYQLENTVGTQQDKLAVLKSNISMIPREKDHLHKKNEIS